MAPRPQMVRSPFIITPVEFQKYKQLFKEYDDAQTGFILASVASQYLSKTGLPPPVLESIWKLADQDHDDMLNEYEFIVALHISRLAQKLVGGSRMDSLAAHPHPEDAARSSAEGEHRQGRQRPAPDGSAQPGEPGLRVCRHG